MEDIESLAVIRKSACGYKQTSSRPKSMSASPPRADIQAPMSVSDRGLEVNFCWKYAKPIITRGCFVGLFLRGVAPAGHWNGGRDGGGAWRSGVRLETDLKDARRNGGTRFKFGRGKSSRSYERRNYSVCATTAFVFASTAAGTWLIAPHLLPSRSSGEIGWLPPGLPEIVYALDGIG